MAKRRTTKTTLQRRERRPEIQPVRELALELEMPRPLSKDRKSVV